MNILFLTMGNINSIEDRTIYCDLLRCFRNKGHKVFVVSPNNKGHGSSVIAENDAKILQVNCGEARGRSNILKKGLAQVSFSKIYKKAIKTHFSNVRFDLVLYSTPPITLTGAVEYVKKRDGARTYLLLKDIFPQNAVDIGMMSTSGLKGLLYKHFRKQEKKLYAISDRIGCMSPANVEYVIKHNPEVDPAKVEVCPNSIEVVDKSVDAETRKWIREKYGIPLDKKVFVYGGNLGKPQGIPFLIECLAACRDIDDAYFLIVGSGTEYGKLEDYEKTSGQNNFMLMKSLPKEDYDTMVGACDVGLIFLDHRFTIPNFPSRLLAYMQAKLPIIACTDPNTDIGKVILENKLGWWCESDNPLKFFSIIKQAIVEVDSFETNEKESLILYEDYSVENAYNIITKSLRGV